MVGADLYGQAMEFPDVLVVKSCRLFCMNCPVAGNLVAYFGKAVDKDREGVVPSAFW